MGCQFHMNVNPTILEPSVLFNFYQIDHHDLLYRVTKESRELGIFTSSLNRMNTIKFELQLSKFGIAVIETPEESFELLGSNSANGLDVSEKLLVDSCRMLNFPCASNDKKIHQVAPAFFIHQHIRGLHIPVNNCLLMGKIQRPGDLDQSIQSIVER